MFQNVDKDVHFSVIYNNKNMEKPKSLAIRDS